MLLSKTALGVCTKRAEELFCGWRGWKEAGPGAEKEGKEDMELEEGNLVGGGGMYELKRSDESSWSTERSVLERFSASSGVRGRSEGSELVVEALGGVGAGVVGVELFNQAGVTWGRVRVRKILSPDFMVTRMESLRVVLSRLPCTR